MQVSVFLGFEQNIKELLMSCIQIMVITVHAMIANRTIKPV